MHYAPVRTDRDPYRSPLKEQTARHSSMRYSSIHHPDLGWAHWGNLTIVQSAMEV